MPREAHRNPDSHFTPAEEAVCRKPWELRLGVVVHGEQELAFQQGCVVAVPGHTRARRAESLKRLARAARTLQHTHRCHESTCMGTYQNMR